MVFLPYGCTDIFDPSVNSNKVELVVDGLITNAAENYSVYLCYANPYNSSSAPVPATNCKLTITDDLGNIFNVGEVGNGYYQTTPSQFVGQVGRTYTLYINSADGTKYKSAGQLMEQVLPIDSIYGQIITKEYQVYAGDGSTYNEYESGINSYVNIHKPANNLTDFNFINTILVESLSTKQVNDTVISGKDTSIELVNKTTYWWNYQNLDDVANIASSNPLTGTSNIVDHPLSFFPTDVKDYYVSGNQTLYNFVLNTKEMAINSDTYNFYNLMDEQLNSGDELFDPVAQQVVGNMTCTSDAGATVLGKFEASSYTNYSYIVTIRNNQVNYSSTPYIGNISHNGDSTAQPSFWR